MAHYIYVKSVVLKLTACKKKVYAGKPRLSMLKWEPVHNRSSQTFEYLKIFKCLARSVMTVFPLQQSTYDFMANHNSCVDSGTTRRFFEVDIYSHN